MCKKSLLKLLFTSVMKNQLEAVKYYHFNRVNINRKMNGESVLHIAARQSTKMVKLLLSLGADLNIKNSNNQTALEISLNCEDYYTARVLILAGGDVNSQSNIGFTALHLAVLYDGIEFADFLLYRGVSIDVTDEDSNTPLHHLAFYGISLSLKMYEFLFSRGANPNAKNKDGWSPLHVFAKNGCDRSVIEIFFKYGADMNIPIDDSRKMTPLHLAVQSGYISTAKALLEFGANVNAQCNTTGIKPIHLVGPINDDLLMYKLLVRNGADINSHDNIEGLTPLMFRLDKPLYGYILPGMSYLLKNSDLNVIDKNGRNILSIIGNQAAVANLLLKHLALVKILDRDIHKSIIDTINSNEIFETTFSHFIKELSKAKNTKIANSWVSFLNILTFEEKQLLSICGNIELIENFKQLIDQFPLYASWMSKRLSNGIVRRKLRDRASVKLSEYLPQFQNPSVTLNVMKFLALKDCIRILLE